LLLRRAVARATSSAAAATAAPALAFTFLSRIKGRFSWFATDEELECLLDFFEDKAGSHFFHFEVRFDWWRRLAMRWCFFATRRLAPGWQRLRTALVRVARATFFPPLLPSSRLFSSRFFST
jgi:hypothetical protein